MISQSNPIDTLASDVDDVWNLTMNHSAKAVGDQRVILIEAAGFGDAEFYGRWLLAAAQAQTILTNIRNSDTGFHERVNGLEWAYKLDFAAIAALIVGYLGSEFPTIAFFLDDECFYADMICVMADAGFFALTGDRYQMTIPVDLDAASVRGAMLKLADTQDADEIAHPQWLIASMSGSEAKAWQQRLSRLTEAARLADRDVLLEPVGY